MQLTVIFYTSCAFLVMVFLVSMALAIKGSQAARYFLWMWAGLLILALPFMTRANTISHAAAALMLLFFFYVLYIAVRDGMKRVDVSHEETRRVLAESSRRVDEERRALTRRLHDDVNPQLLMIRNIMEQLKPLVRDNDRAAELVVTATTMLGEAYTHMRDIIKNTRIEVIDSIGFTAALESLVAHYANISEKPAITLEHNLPKRPALPEAVAVSAYKIIREAIFNAIKHANAAQVSVSVQYNKVLNSYRVEITDDGVGVKAASRSSNHAGIGLIDMRERAMVLGEGLRVQAANPSSTKRPGTRISFSFSGQSS